MREARQAAPRTRPAAVTALRRLGRDGSPVVTYSIIGLCALIYVLQLATGQYGPIFQALAFSGFFAGSEPWRMITSMFVHLSILHILFNMYSLFIFGPMLESMLGRARFVALFFLAGFGGSVAVLLISPQSAVAGASGAIFGLLGAYFMIQRHLGGSNVQLLVVIGLNLVIGFVVPNIAWQAHLGGLIVGALVGFIFVKTRSRSKRTAQLIGLGGTAVGLVALTVAGVGSLSAGLFG